jgi:hypothetical protein
VSIKDHAILALIASLELYTNRMSGFMGPDKPSNFYDYYVKQYLPASYDAFTFGGRMKPRARTSSREQESDFDIVETCEWLSYMRASESQAYVVLVKFFSYRVYIDSSHRDTLSFEWQLVVVVVS